MVDGYKVELHELKRQFKLIDRKIDAWKTERDEIAQEIDRLRRLRGIK
jgi:hypothetical protein